jgi:hypothetical protein
MVAVENVKIGCVISGSVCRWALVVSMRVAFKINGPVSLASSLALEACAVIIIGPAIENKSNKIMVVGTTAAFQEVRTFYLLLIVILIFHRFFQDQGARPVVQGGSGTKKYQRI